jgi:hypothetical protein
LKTPKGKKAFQAALPAALFVAVLAQWFMGQNHAPATLIPALFFYVLAVYLWFFALKTEKRGFLKEKPLPRPLEGAIFGLIIFLAAFLRIYKLDSLPSGIYLDASGPALYALRTLHENFEPPFMLPAFAANPAYLVYLLAAWFKWFSPTQVNLFMFFVIFALGALPLIYWTIRQLAGPRTALLTLFFITIMRWHLVFSRIGFRGIQVPFYMFGTLAFLLYGLKQRKPWALFLSALFLTGGLYTYQAFKAFPLLVLILLVYEYKQDPKGFKALWKPLAVSAVLFLVLAFPLLHSWIQEGSLGRRESQIFIGKEVVQEKSLKPLMVKIAQTALMFNRKGEDQPRHNLKDHAILDGITGIFFILGFFYALWKFTQRPYFYAVCGFLVMSLPGFLSSEETQSHRMLGALPFVAFFAAVAVLAWREGMAERFPSYRTAVKSLVVGLLIFAAVDNLKTYFVDQAGDYDCWRDFNIEATTVGKTVVGHPDTVFYLAPAFYEHFTVQYLDYFDSSRVHSLDLGVLNHQPLDNHLSKVCFVLDEGKSPTLNFLESLYPNGTEEPFKDRYGKTLAFFYYVPGPVKPLSFQKGLEMQVSSTGSNGLMLTSSSKLEPLVNYTNIGDLGISHSPFLAVWSGKLLVPATGFYDFLILSKDTYELNLDSHILLNSLFGKEGTTQLTAGWHPLELICRRDNNPDVALDFHLLWKKPGSPNYEVVPNAAFGEIPGGVTSN